MHILPAIDLKQDDRGFCRCVHLEQGKEGSKTEFSGLVATVDLRLSLALKQRP